MERPQLKQWFIFWSMADILAPQWGQLSSSPEFSRSCCRLSCSCCAADRCPKNSVIPINYLIQQITCRAPGPQARCRYLRYLDHYRAAVFPIFRKFFPFFNIKATIPINTMQGKPARVVTMDGRLREIEQWLQSAKAELRDGDTGAYIDRLYLLNAEIRNTLRDHHSDPAPPRRTTRPWLLPSLGMVTAALVLAAAFSLSGTLIPSVTDNISPATRTDTAISTEPASARPRVDAALNSPGTFVFPGSTVIKTAWWHSTPRSEQPRPKARQAPQSAAAVTAAPAKEPDEVPTETAAARATTPQAPVTEPVDVVTVDTVDSPAPDEAAVEPAEESRLDPGALIDALEKGLSSHDG
jgi:hypothetical protein